MKNFNKTNKTIKNTNPYIKYKHLYSNWCSQKKAWYKAFQHTLGKPYEVS